MAYAPKSVPIGNNDYALALAVVGILAIFFVPIPPFLIDFGLAISIALSVTILLVALWIEKPTDFSAFPTILLIATTLRLALNIATTRLNLSGGSHGDAAAGYVISGFSRLLMQGDFIIGIVVFIIVVTVNFVVITKGATRIAEVGARFTLDSIPGKQMAIDADLSAGLINDQQAQKRRAELEEETAFFGSMDGASKFVRGDAIAGIIILFVNSIGGIILGTFRHKLSFSDAADVFTRLSIGDGLVTQIPALIIALAAGLVVSKGGTRGSADKAVIGQLSHYPKALWVSATLMLIVAVLPGMPIAPFLILAIICGFVADKSKKELLLLHAAADQEVVGPPDTHDFASATVPRPAVIEIVLGRILAARFLNPRSDVSRRIGRLRRSLSRDFGFVIPEIRLREDFELSDSQYRILVQGAFAATAELHCGDVIVIGATGILPSLQGEKTTEPAFGIEAARYPEAFSDEIRRQGFEPVNVESILLTHLAETLRDNLGSIFSYRDIRALIDNLEPEYRRLFDEVCPGLISVSGIMNIAKALLSERVSIRNLPLLLESVAEVASQSRRLEQIVDAVRMRLAPQMCGDASDRGVLRVLKLGARWDTIFSNCIKRDSKGEVVEFALDPVHIESFGAEAALALREHLGQGLPFVVVTAPEARPFVRMLIARINAAIPVFSHLEISRCRDIVAIGSIAQ